MCGFLVQNVAIQFLLPNTLLTSFKRIWRRDRGHEGGKSERERRLTIRNADVHPRSPILIHGRGVGTRLQLGQVSLRHRAAPRLEHQQQQPCEHAQKPLQCRALWPITATSQTPPLPFTFSCNLSRLIWPYLSLTPIPALNPPPLFFYPVKLELGLNSCLLYSIPFPTPVLMPCAQLREQTRQILHTWKRWH